MTPLDEFTVHDVLRVDWDGKENIRNKKKGMMDTKLSDEDS